MICSSFQPGNKVVKKALVSINHQYRNCSQADVSGQALYPGRLMCMKPAFLRDLQDLKDALIFLAGKYFQTRRLRPFPLILFKLLKNRSGVPLPGNRTESWAISWTVKRTDICQCLVQVLWAGIWLKTGLMVAEKCLPLTYKYVRKSYFLIPDNTLKRLVMCTCNQ